MKKRFLAAFLATLMVIGICSIVNAAEQVGSGTVTVPEKSWIIDGGFETAKYINEDSPSNMKTYIPTFTSTDDDGNSTERPAKNAQIMDDEGFAAEGKQCLFLSDGENLTIKIPNLAKYKGDTLILKYYVRAKTGTSSYGTWGRIEDRSIMVPDKEAATGEKAQEVYVFENGVSYWNHPDDFDFYGKWTLLTEEFTIPDTVTSTSQYVFNFGCYGAALYYDGISCVVKKADGKFVEPSEFPDITPGPKPTPTSSQTNAPTAKPSPTKGPKGPLTDRAIAGDGATWTAREVPEGTVVTLKPDYDEDSNVELSNIKGGGFESTQGWSDELNTLMFWMDAGGENYPNWKPWEFTKAEKVEGEQSACVDVSTDMIELSPNGTRLPCMGFVGVFVAPCFGNEVYHLRFYTKVDRELGMEDPQLEVYMLDLSQDDDTGNAFKNTVGTINVPLDASSVDAHWYDQNKVVFKDGTNSNGEFKQGEGPFSKGKWIQIDAYFVTPEDFIETVYSVTIQTKETADCKIYFDAFSLEKISMDEVDLGKKLVAPTPKPTLSPTPTQTATPVVSATPSPTATATTTVSPSNKPVKKSVKFTKKSVKIKRGKKATLKVKITGAKKAKFSVDKKGKKVVKLMKKKAKSVVVKGKKKGKAVITAKAAGKKAKCKVTVK